MMNDSESSSEYGDRDLVGRGPAPDRLGRSLYTVGLPRQAVAQRRLVADGGSPGVGHSVWLRPDGGLSAQVFAESALPVWALERITVQFAQIGARVGICHGPGPARTGLDAVPDSRWSPDWLAGGELYHAADEPPVLDLALVLAEPLAHEPAATGEVTGPFWRTLRRAVRPGGIVLVHTRQRNDDGVLIDPIGRLTREAARGGLGYLQHHVLVHAPLLDKPLGAADPAPRDAAGDGPRHRAVHSDLLAFRVSS